MKDADPMTEGLNLSVSDTTTFVVINDLTEELKQLLRDRLSEICWGPTANGAALNSQAYKATMRSLWLRISKKPENTKIGMIGELVTHLILASEDLGYVSVNRFFNLEEASIKKGFDLVVKSTSRDELYFVEVKSSATDGDNAAGKVIALFGIGNKDMMGKLNAPADNLWDNALAHCSSALRKTKLRDRVEELLESFKEEAYEAPSSKNQNVILSAVSFTDTGKFCLEAELEQAMENKVWGDFKSLHFFAAQKKTYLKIMNFIEQEAK